MQWHRRAHHLGRFLLPTRERPFPTGLDAQLQGRVPAHRRRQASRQQPHHLSEHELNCLEAVRAQQLDLLSGEALEGPLGHEEGRARAGRLPYGASDVGLAQAIARVDAPHGLMELRTEDVVDLCPPKQFTGSPRRILHHHRGAVQRLRVVGAELVNHLQHEGALVRAALETLVAKVPQLRTRAREAAAHLLMQSRKRRTHVREKQLVEPVRKVPDERDMDEIWMRYG